MKHSVLPVISETFFRSVVSGIAFSPKQWDCICEPHCQKIRMPEAALCEVFIDSIFDTGLRKIGPVLYQILSKQCFLYS